MGDKDAFTKARMELEALYEGVPDDSVNLTFKHLTDIKLHPNSSMEKKNKNSSIPKDEQKSTPLSKLPSLDFNRGLEAANQQGKISLHPSAQMGGARGLPLLQPQQHGTLSDNQSQSQQMNLKSHHHHYHHHHLSSGGFREALERSKAYSDVSPISVSSMHHRGATGRRRPGIPHSNICTNCSTYIYIFRHRCLVCGRVYCRLCVRIGMGEMIEGRKCVECLGRRFSHRYIARAGAVGCLYGWRYPSTVKQEELKWAEKGPRRKGEKPMQLQRERERRYGDHGHGVSGISSSMMWTSPISMSEQSPWAATSANASIIGSPRFAVMSSPYSPAHRHHIPF